MESMRSDAAESVATAETVGITSPGLDETKPARRTCSCPSLRFRLGGVNRDELHLSEQFHESWISVIAPEPRLRRDRVHPVRARLEALLERGERRSLVTERR